MQHFGLTYNINDTRTNSTNNINIVFVIQEIKKYGICHTGNAIHVAKLEVGAYMQKGKYYNQCQHDTSEPRLTAVHTLSIYVTILNSKTFKNTATQLGLQLSDTNNMGA